MKIINSNFLWIAPTAAVVFLASGYLGRTYAPTAANPVQVAAAPAPIAPVVAPVAAATSATPDETQLSTAELFKSIVEQTKAPEVTRAASFTALVGPEPVVESPNVTEVSIDTTISDDPVAFFANASANLMEQSSCGDDLRALAAQSRIYFPSGGLSGGDAGLAQARLIGQVLSTCPGYIVRVEGHSDPSGDPAINLQLSQQRAEYVVSRLAASGMETSRFVAQGFGDQRPSNISGVEPDAYYDRRVEFSIIEEEAPVAFAAPNPFRQGGCGEELAVKFETTKVYYAPGSIMIPAADFDQVLGLATETAKCSDVKLRIVGQHSDMPGTRESITTGRLRALAIMNSLVAAGFDADQILIGAPSWSKGVPGQPSLPNSRVDFELIPVEG